MALSLDGGFPAIAFRLPGDDCLYWGACEPNELRLLAEDEPLPMEGGFIFAPFDKGDHLFFPTCLQPIGKIECRDLPVGEPVAECAECCAEDSSLDDYFAQVDQLVEAMKEGEIRKAVLSRAVTVDRPRLSDAQLFLRLTEKYPSAFVSWVHRPGKERWIGATPETLLDYDGHHLASMSLAGTRTAGTLGEWGAKEQEEQQIVTDYIYSIFKELTDNPELGERFTRSAGPVEHLCTPIIASGRYDSSVLTRLVSALHPTPAVCGFPKEESLRWINRVEKNPRSYYGGYLGPVSVEAMRLFVNLRCMAVTDRYVRLYVGGGLTALSQPDSEWRETEAKAQTLLAVMDVNE